MIPTHVAVYTRDRSYGGPEEGGWWYSSGSLVAFAMVRDGEEAERVVDTFCTVYDENTYSVLVLDSDSEDDAEWFTYHGDVIREYPAVRPHYE